MNRSDMLQRIIYASLLVGFTAISLRVGGQLGPKERASIDPFAPPPLTHLPRPWVDTILLGHRGVYDDFLGIWTIQTIMDPSVMATAPIEKVHPFLMAAVQQQPRNEALYLLACFVVALDKSAPEHCAEYTTTGLRVFPNSWRILMTQAFVESFRLKNNARAAVLFGLAAQTNNAPPWVIKAAQRFATLAQDDQQGLTEAINTFSENAEGRRMLEILLPKNNPQQGHAPPSAPQNQQATPPPISVTPSPSTTDDQSGETHGN